MCITDFSFFDKYKEIKYIFEKKLDIINFHRHPEKYTLTWNPVEMCLFIVTKEDADIINEKFSWFNEVCSFDETDFI